MNVRSYQSYSARVEFDDEDGLFVGRIVGIADSVSFHGANVSDLGDAFREAVDDYVVACAKIGWQPQTAESSGKSLNQWSEQALDSAARHGVKGGSWAL